MIKKYNLKRSVVLITKGTAKVDETNYTELKTKHEIIYEKS